MLATSFATRLLPHRNPPSDARTPITPRPMSCTYCFTPPPFEIDDRRVRRRRRGPWCRCRASRLRQMSLPVVLSSATSAASGAPGVTITRSPSTSGDSANIQPDIIRPPKSRVRLRRQRSLPVAVSRQTTSPSVPTRTAASPSTVGVPRGPAVLVVPVPAPISRRPDLLAGVLAERDDVLAVAPIAHRVDAAADDATLEKPAPRPDALPGERRPSASHSRSRPSSADTLSRFGTVPLRPLRRQRTATESQSPGPRRRTMRASSTSPQRSLRRGPEAARVSRTRTACRSDSVSDFDRPTSPSLQRSPARPTVTPANRRPGQPRGSSSRPAKEGHEPAGPRLMKARARVLTEGRHTNHDRCVRRAVLSNRRVPGWRRAPAARLALVALAGAVIIWHRLGSPGERRRQPRRCRSALAHVALPRMPPSRRRPSPAARSSSRCA